VRPSYDAIAIGGGLAGCAFAITLAQSGLRVAIIESTSAPRLKVCGDFLSAEAQVALDDLGLDIWQMGARGIRVLRLSNGSQMADAPLPFLAAGLSRLRLDEALLACAVEAGATVLRGCSAGGLQCAEDVCAVRVGTHRLTARWVALATGKHNFRNLPRMHGHLSAFKMSFELTAGAREALAQRVQVMGYNGGYIGACSIENGAATLCWLADPARMRRSGGRWHRQLDALSHEAPLVGDLLSGARPLTPKPASIAAIPYGYRRRGVIHPRVFPLGDQLAVIPSFTGDGTSIALSSGVAAAEAILRGETAADFQDSFHRRLSGQFRWAGVTDLLFKSAALRRVSLAAIGAAPGIATQLARMTRLGGCRVDCPGGRRSGLVGG